MNVYEEDRFAWLLPEKAFIAEAVAAGKVVLGVCLGAQLLSVVLGGSVAQNPQREIGWFPVNLTPAAASLPLFRDFPERFMAFHWHGDCFTIPPGAVHVARTEACDAQGFVHGDRVVGLQFHLESTPESIGALIEHCGHAAPSEQSDNYIQDPPTMEEHFQRLPETHALLEALLDALAPGR